MKKTGFFGRNGSKVIPDFRFCFFGMKKSDIFGLGGTKSHSRFTILPFWNEKIRLFGAWWLEKSFRIYDFAFLE